MDIDNIAKLVQAFIIVIAVIYYCKAEDGSSAGPGRSDEFLTPPTTPGRSLLERQTRTPSAHGIGYSTTLRRGPQG